MCCNLNSQHLMHCKIGLIQNPFTYLKLKQRSSPQISPIFFQNLPTFTEVVKQFSFYLLFKVITSLHLFLLAFLPLACLKQFDISAHPYSCSQIENSPQTQDLFSQELSNFDEFINLYPIQSI